MADSLLRVALLVLGLLLHPQEDRQHLDRDHIILAGPGEPNEWLTREEEPTRQEVQPNKELTREEGQPDQEPDSHRARNMEHVGVENHVDSVEGGARYQPPQKTIREEEPSKTFHPPHESRSDDIWTGEALMEQKEASGPEEELEPEPEPVPDLLIEPENGTSEESFAGWDDDLLWLIWNVFSIISLIQFLRRHRTSSQISADRTGADLVGVDLPDSDTLRRFYRERISSGGQWQEEEGEEFLDGFLNDLLEAMRGVASRTAALKIRNFTIANRSDVMVALSPSESFRFEFVLKKDQRQGFCGQIRLVKDVCSCQSDGGDAVCLLHSEILSDPPDALLCSEKTGFLSQSKVSRWFHSSVQQAWDQISHRFEFQLQGVGGPSGGLQVRFRSGKRVKFSLQPVVPLNSCCQFIVGATLGGRDGLWMLSFSQNEDRLLDGLSLGLPEDSCHLLVLETACFLLKTQTRLSGRSNLRSSHFKAALIHLIQTTPASQWNQNLAAPRLRDLLDFMQTSLQERRLIQILVPDLPAELQVEPINLLQPLVDQDWIYWDTLDHFREMLRNTKILIQDYVPETEAEEK